MGDKEPIKQQVWARISPPSRKQLEKQAKKCGVSLSEYVRRVLEDVCIGRDPRDLVRITPRKL